MLRRLSPAALAVAVVAVVFGFALPRIADYGAVLDIVRTLSWLELAVLLVVTGLNIATFAPPWMTALPALGFRRAIVMTQASTAAASVLPGGEAFGAASSFAMLRAWGYGRGAVAAAVAVIAALNLLVKVAFPVAAVAALLATGADVGSLGAVAAVGCVVAAVAVAVVALAFRREGRTRALAARLDAAAERLRSGRPHGQPFSERLVHFRREAVRLLGRRWIGLVVWTVIGHLCVFLVLLVTLRTLGLRDVDAAQAFAAWALTRLLTAIPITPGGLGIVELGLTGALVTAGADNARAVAAVLVYRSLTWLPPIVIGGAASLLWRRLGRVAV